MPGGETQPRSGHLNSTSVNTKDKSGAEPGVLRQPKGSNRVTDTYPHTRSANSADKGGRDATGDMGGPEGRASTGTVRNERRSGGSTRRVGNVRRS